MRADFFIRTNGVTEQSLRICRAGVEFPLWQYGRGPRCFAAGVVNQALLNIRTARLNAYPSFGCCIQTMSSNRDVGAQGSRDAGQI